ncbi:MULTISPECIES: class I SAM-dependent methyltransferase [unclassified Alistipes]|uniref:class I SAM-dependent methyltransferase n=1 Tax=unclassified Alistipes TaxID=2608932 RepID=UPI0007A8E0BE|nr:MULTISPECIES: class I SAM-dependent methyltransferase [unclassified Alistipes]CVI71058.1 Ribosomal RNA large subunit methyltransferase I [Alistipes sp. CHKCI003]HJC76741.1 class I SAM-dependent methyltransferase [Candidatus Alistipes excrementavium]
MQEQLTPRFADYELIDTGDFEKLERFGPYVTRRPEPQAIWRRSLSEEEWRRMADASFLRDARSEERGQWSLRPRMPERWTVGYDCGGTMLRMRLGLTSFKHVGLFPEQAANWDFIRDSCAALRADGLAPRVLNLFAYTGGATLAARAAGAEATHVDSVKQVVAWARENMEASGLEGVRWIVEDALRFVRREVRRGSRYRGIILDPPAYGRGANGERWILEENICEMLECCARLLEPAGAFLVLNLYSMGLSSTLARTAVRQAFGVPRGEQYGELCFADRAGKVLPLGTYYRMTR